MKRYTYLLTAVLWAASGTTVAEGVLLKSEPRDNEVVKAFGGHVSLWFSGNVGPRAPSLLVVDSQGQRVDNGQPNLEIDDRSKLSVTTGPLPAGAYAVRYRVVTQDGLVVSGIRRFTVKP